MKPISKSKRQLAQLLIEAGVEYFPYRANWAAQDDDSDVDFYEDKPTRVQGDNWYGVYDYKNRVVLCNKIPNWHQTVLSRDEFDQIVAESEPQYCESVTAPTLDQLLQDYRNAAEYAARKQAEADDAAKMRDERWKKAQERACELGVCISAELVVDAEIRESEPVITDWRDLRVGDEVECISTPAGAECKPGMIGIVTCVRDDGIVARFEKASRDGRNGWFSHKGRGYSFIRRP